MGTSHPQLLLERGNHNAAGSSPASRLGISLKTNATKHSLNHKTHLHSLNQKVDCG